MYEVTDDCDGYSTNTLQTNLMNKFIQWLQDYCFVDAIELCNSILPMVIDEYECRESTVAYAAITWGIDLEEPSLVDIGNVINDLEAAYLDGELILEDWDLSENLFAQPSITCPNFFYPDLIKRMKLASKLQPVHYP